MSDSLSANERSGWDLATAREHFLESRFEPAYWLCRQALAVFGELAAQVTAAAPEDADSALVEPQALADLPGSGSEELTDRASLLEWLDLAAAASYRLGLYREADRWLGLALALRLRAEVRLENGLERLAYTWLSLGQIERASAHLHQAERLKKRYYDPNQSEMLVPTLEAQVGLALVSGRYPLAERFAKRAVARASRPGALQTRALTCLARVMWYQDRPREAQAVCQDLLRQEAPTAACERWHWAHMAISHALAGDLAGACHSARALGALQGQNRSLQLGWKWLTGQLAWLQSDLPKAVEDWQTCRKLAAELYPAAHFQRALVAYSLAQAWWDNKQIDAALEMADEVIRLCPPFWFGGKALRSLGLDLLARGCIERQQTSRALELTAEALQCLRGDDNQWLAVGAGGVAHWHDGLDDQEPGTWMPLCWPLGGLTGERDLQARALATRAKALRQGNWEDHARAAARLAKNVRKSTGHGHLTERPAQGFVATRLASLGLTVQAAGRFPSWLRIEDDTGHRSTVGLESPSGTILVAENAERRLLQPDHPLFCAPLEEGPLEINLLVTYKGAKRVGMMPYLVTLGFQTGPPLRIPVRID